MSPGRAALVVLLGIVVSACAEDRGSVPPSAGPVPTAASANGELRIAPAETHRGATVELRFSGALAELRGGYYHLVDAAGSQVALLWSDGNDEIPLGYELDPRPASTTCARPW